MLRFIGNSSSWVVKVVEIPGLTCVVVAVLHLARWSESLYCFDQEVLAPCGVERTRWEVHSVRHVSRAAFWGGSIKKLQKSDFFWAKMSILNHVNITGALVICSKQCGDWRILQYKRRTVFACQDSMTRCFRLTSRGRDACLTAPGANNSRYATANDFTFLFSTPMRTSIRCSAAAQ